MFIVNAYSTLPFKYLVGAEATTYILQQTSFGGLTIQLMDEGCKVVKL